MHIPLARGDPAQAAMDPAAPSDGRRVAQSRTSLLVPALCSAQGD